MPTGKEIAINHPNGEPELEVEEAPSRGSKVDTYGGTIHVRWDGGAPVTPFGRQGWKAVEDKLALTGWSSKRRVIVLRRRMAGTTRQQQLALGFLEIAKDGPLYEYAVLASK